ncbi:hypothetical protein Csa_011203 [Cucumis sativus]|uniref:Uncharacterized protein n=1 Tax=Cucumis sativus TaxID=3659 RepID=A0A0A0LBY3_CUCSA|nr:hypothetical protein Csa_011203 [Cucumis sativus]
MQAPVVAFVTPLPFCLTFSSLLRQLHLTNPKFSVVVQLQSPPNRFGVFGLIGLLFQLFEHCATISATSKVVIQFEVARRTRKKERRKKLHFSMRLPRGGN